MINETIEIVAQYIAMYAPTVLTALGVIATYVKVFIGLKSNADNIMNNPKMVELKEELNNTKEELALMRSKMTEMLKRQGELINELSKVVKYEDRENDQM